MASVQPGNGTRQGAWPAASTAADPRSLRYTGGGDIYPTLGFLATASPNASNASLQVAISVTAADMAAPAADTVCATGQFRMLSSVGQTPI